MKRNEKQAIEELARLLDGDVPADDVPAPVRELASLATAVRHEVDVPRPTPAFKAALRTQLLDDLAVTEVSALDRLRDAISERTTRWRYSARLVVASATASGMLGTAGVAVAAQQALPGELLYPVKQITEDVRMGFARGYVETGRLHLTFASERLEELTDGIETYEPDTVIDLLGDMDQETLAGTDDLLRAYDETGNELILVVLERFADEQRRGLTAVFDQLPSEASPFVDRSFEILRRIEVTLATIKQGCASCAAEASGTDGLPHLGVNAPGDGPAITDGCDCAALLPSSLRARAAAAAEALRETLSGDGDADEGDSGDGDFDGDLNATVPSLPAPLDGFGRSVESAFDGLGGDSTRQTVEDTTKPVEDTTKTTTDVVEGTTKTTTDTTGTTTGGSATEPVEDTTGTLDELLDDASDTLP